MKTVIEQEISRPDVAMYGDIVYANPFNDFLQESIPLKLCLLRPFYELDKWEKRPLLIWVGGGAWRSSTPMRRIPELSYYAYHGYVVASIQYRVSSEGLFPAQIEDVKAAIRYLRAHADQYGIDCSRIALMGDSAGAHLVSLAGVTNGSGAYSTDEWRHESDEVQAVVEWYGPADFREFDKMLIEKEQKPKISQADLLLGEPMKENPALAAEASPCSYIAKGKNIPPFMILHGTDDQLVPVEESRSLYAKLTAAGYEAEYYEISGAGHDCIQFSQPEMQERILTFLNKKLDTEPF